MRKLLICRTRNPPSQSTTSTTASMMNINPSFVSTDSRARREYLQEIRGKPQGIRCFALYNDLRLPGVLPCAETFSAEDFNWLFQWLRSSVLKQNAGAEAPTQLQANMRSANGLRRSTV